MRLTRALVAAVVVVATFALAGDTRLADNRQAYLQFNLCGNACSRGALEIAENVAEAIQRRRPVTVTLNEVCENQYDRLRAELPDYRGWFDPTGAGCRNGARYGNVILARASDLRPVGSWGLPNPAGDEPRRLACVRTQSSANPLTVCVTHISNETGNIEAQVSAVATILSGLRSEGALLLGGDFNTDPSDARLNPMYATCYAGGAGSFREVDSFDCADRGTVNAKGSADVLNEDTYGGQKFDYIFLSDGHWSSAEADATELGPSDHDALWAETRLR